MSELETKLQHSRYEAIVLHRAIEVNGAQRQIEKAEEELIELLDAIKHRNRDGGIAHLHEELADVRIMLDQLEIIFNCADAVRGVRAYKLANLHARSQSGEPF